jgi:flagellar hook-length control protein FliK
VVVGGASGVAANGAAVASSMMQTALTDTAQAATQSDANGQISEEIASIAAGGTSSSMPESAQFAGSAAQASAESAAASASTAPATSAGDRTQSEAARVAANAGLGATGERRRDAERAGNARGASRGDAAQSSSAGSGGANASSTNAAGASNATTARDPLARLIDSAQAILRSATGAIPGSNATSGTAVGGRLAEVEATVARDRAAQAVAGSGAELAVNSGTAGAGAGIAGGLVSGDPSAGGAAVAPTANLAASATSAAFALAGDLASASADAAPQAAHIAAKGAEVLASQRGGAITMRLEPPALGQLRIELQISQGAVVADFTAATPEARVLLEANLGMLRERLESQGLSVDRLTVHGGGRGTESAPVAAGQGAGDARQQSNDGADARSNRGDRGEARQDAAGGESRGRRDGDARDSNEGRRRTDAQANAQGARGFAGVLQAGMHGTDAVRRAG